jgi:hypothetical protein
MGFKVCRGRDRRETFGGNGFKYEAVLHTLSLTTALNHWTAAEFVSRSSCTLVGHWGDVVDLFSAEGIPRACRVQALYISALVLGQYHFYDFLAYFLSDHYVLRYSRILDCSLFLSINTDLRSVCGLLCPNDPASNLSCNKQLRLQNAAAM